MCEYSKDLIHEDTNYLLIELLFSSQTSSPFLSVKGMKKKPKASTSFPKKRVGDYELCEVLGEGSFATVRRARHTKTGHEFAVKCLDKQQIEKQHMSKQLKREIAIMRLIKHPRVVQFYEVLASKTKIYLVLELVEGGELFDLVSRELSLFNLST